MSDRERASLSEHLFDILVKIENNRDALKAQMQREVEEQGLMILDHAGADVGKPGGWTDLELEVQVAIDEERRVRSKYTDAFKRLGEQEKRARQVLRRLHPPPPPISIPTTQPTTQPTSQPGSQPTTQPTSQPGSQPTSQPSTHPSSLPSTQPGGSVPSAESDAFQDHADITASYEALLDRYQGFFDADPDALSAELATPAVGQEEERSDHHSDTHSFSASDDEPGHSIGIDGDEVYHGGSQDLDALTPGLDEPHQVLAPDAGHDASPNSHDDGDGQVTYLDTNHDGLADQSTGSDLYHPDSLDFTPAPDEPSSALAGDADHATDADHAQPAQGAPAQHDHSQPEAGHDPGGDHAAPDGDPGHG